jgi:hypothetical protein
MTRASRRGGRCLPPQLVSRTPAGARGAPRASPAVPPELSSESSPVGAPPPPQPAPAPPPASAGSLAASTAEPDGGPRLWVEEALWRRDSEGRWVSSSSTAVRRASQWPLLLGTSAAPLPVARTAPRAHRAPQVWPSPRAQESLYSVCPAGLAQGWRCRPWPTSDARACRHLRVSRVPPLVPY